MVSSNSNSLCNFRGGASEAECRQSDLQSLSSHLMPSTFGAPISFYLNSCKAKRKLYSNSTIIKTHKQQSE